MRSLSKGFEMRRLLKPIPIEDTRPNTFKDLWDSEWSKDFENLQRHRLVQGFFRYGGLNAPNKKSWDRVPDIIKRAELYSETHNLEYLVDIANLCMLEFEEGKHQDRHFESHDDLTHTNEL